MRLFAVLLAATLAGAAAAGIATAGTSAGSVGVTIRHQVQHCHAWSVNGGPFAAAQKLSVKRGATITFTNDDVMSHKLIELAGARVAMHNGVAMHASAIPGLMNKMGSTTKLTFMKPGVYHFGTRAGEDYMAGVKTIGEDNVLTLTVTVH
jgi:plastocyanin